MGPSRLLADRAVAQPGFSLAKPLIRADEAYQWGLVNRLTQPGEALREAVALAAEIGRFPQRCLRADRASAYAGWSRELDAALRAEAERGQPVLAAESVAGATRFSSGLGRRGDFEEI